MSHHGWVMVSFITELLSSYGSHGQPATSSSVPSVCSDDIKIINNLLKVKHFELFQKKHQSTQ